MSHGGLKRARSWKRRIQPKEAYSSPGLLYSEESSAPCRFNDKGEGAQNCGTSRTFPRRVRILFQRSKPDAD